jgi:hypothetical protein
VSAPYREPPAGRPSAEQRSIVTGRWKLRVFEDPDGSSRIFVGAHASVLLIIAFALLSLILGVFSLGIVLFERQPWSSTPPEVDFLVGALLVVGAMASIRTLLRLVAGGEDFAVSAAGLVWKRRFTPWRRPICQLTTEVSTILVTGEGEGGQLLIQLGRRTVEVCAGLGLNDAARREVAHVLRAALARASERR